MLRVLQVVGNMDFGGVETLLMEIFRKVDREQIQFDFLCHNDVEGKFDQEIKSMGGRIYRIPGIGKSNIFKYYCNLLRFFKAHPNYSIVHSHLNGTNGIVLRQAKKANIPIRISHSHINNPKYTFLRYLLRKYSVSKVQKVATHAFACSKEAAEYLYTNKYLLDNCIILNNAIDTQRFTYNEQSGQLIRDKYGLTGKMVFGHVGRFEEQKNHRFIIEVFNELSKHYSEAVLMLVGVGSLENEIKMLVEKLGITDRVLFLGAQPDIPALMSAMDYFLFPSLYEGLGIVAVEAQSIGLPIFASDAVPKATELTDLITYVPLLESAKNWAGIIIDYINKNRQKPRVEYADIVKEKGYDITSVAKELQNIYIDLNPEIEKS